MIIRIDARSVISNPHLIQIHSAKLLHRISPILRCLILCGLSRLPCIELSGIVLPRSDTPPIHVDEYLLHTRLPGCPSAQLREHCCTPPIDFKTLTIVFIRLASVVRIRHISASHCSYHSFHKQSALLMFLLCVQGAYTPPPHTIADI